MKILHVIPSLASGTGGPAVNSIALCHQMNLLGHQTRILTTDALTPAQASTPRAGATIVDFPRLAREVSIGIFPLKQPYRWAFSPALYHALGQELPDSDIVHIHSINLFPQFAAWKIAELHNKPYLVSPRGGLDPWIRGKRTVLKRANDLIWQRKMLSNAGALHLTSEDERRLIAPLGFTSPQVVVPNGFDVAAFRHPGNPRAFRMKWLEGFAGPLVFNHGRLSPKKGLDILVDAVARIQRHSVVRLAIAGADDEGVGSALHNQAARLGTEDSVTLIPSLSGIDLLDAIAAADVWVLPSHTENFGMSVVEAMAAGKVVVTSPQVNIAPDAAAADALVMVPNTPSDVAAAISSLLVRPSHSSAIGRRAADYVWRYDWSLVGHQYIDLYETIISNKDRGQ